MKTKCKKNAIQKRMAFYVIRLLDFIPHLKTDSGNRLVGQRFL